MSNRISDFFSGGVPPQPNRNSLIAKALENVQGDLLVASPLLESTPLARTVVYV